MTNIELLSATGEVVLKLIIGLVLGIAFCVGVLLFAGFILPSAHADEITATRDARLGEEDRSISPSPGGALYDDSIMAQAIFYDIPMLFVPGHNSFCRESNIVRTKAYISKLEAMPDYEPVFPQYSRAERLEMAHDRLGTIERCVTALRAN